MDDRMLGFITDAVSAGGMVAELISENLIISERLLGVALSVRVSSSSTEPSEDMPRKVQLTGSRRNGWLREVLNQYAPTDAGSNRVILKTDLRRAPKLSSYHLVLAVAVKPSVKLPIDQ